MNKWNELKDTALKAFVSGLRGDRPPPESGRKGWLLVIARDGVLTLTELLLTAAGIFACVEVENLFVKMLLVLAVVVSALRTYTTASQLSNELFQAPGPDNKGP